MTGPARVKEAFLFTGQAAVGINSMDNRGTHAHSQTCRVTWWKMPDTPYGAAKDLVHLLEPRFITNFPIVHVSLPLLIHTRLRSPRMRVCVHAWTLGGCTSLVCAHETSVEGY